MKHKIIFQPYGIRTEISEDETILAAAQKSGATIEAYCGGNKACGKCKIKISEKFLKNINPLSIQEKNILTQNEINNGYRLACETKVLGDIIVDIPIESQTSKQVIVENGVGLDFKLNPAVKSYHIQLKSPNIEDNDDDFTRLKKALKEKNPNIIDKITIDISLLRNLSEILRTSDWNVTVLIWENKKIINVYKGFYKNIYGVAIDLGTTTIAAYLCNLNNGEVVYQSSIMNPQIRFGDDVLTRISYCTNNKDGLYQLNTCVIDGINELIDKLRLYSNIKENDIAEVTIVANTVMEHILLNIPPKYIGVSPFILSTSDSIDIVPSQLGINILKTGNIHILPSEAGFVGADNVAVLIAQQPYKDDKIKLIIDIGTNSEICLGNKDKLYTTSCATGPALEGAQIKCGMRAAVGAIESIEINKYNLEPTIKIIGNVKTPIGICGSGIIDVISQMYLCGIIEPNGNFSKKICSDRIRIGIDGKKEYVIYFKQNDEERDIVVTQQDIRSVQLAKAALYSGAKLLMKKCNIKQLDEIILAGAFGSYINKKNALALGMYPDCKYDKVSVVGNSAGIGAKMALLSIDMRKEAKKISKNVHFIETAGDTSYQKMFADAMMIPHKKDTFIKNINYKCNCTGTDKRQLDDKVISFGDKVFTNIEIMKKAFEIMKNSNNKQYIRMPIMQNIEAVYFGNKPKLSNKCYVPEGYKYNKIEEIQNLKLENIEYLSSLIDCIKEIDDKIIIDVECPFSILSSMIKPVVLYSSAKKNSDIICSALDKITDFLINYVKECIENGVKIISIADAEGDLSLVGSEFFNKFSGLYVYKFLKGIEPYLKKASVHICPKTSLAMEKMGYFVHFVYRGDIKKTYQENVIDLSQNKNIKFIGNKCLNTSTSEDPIIHCFNLV